MSMLNLVFIVATGLVAAGLVDAAWAAATGEALRPRVLEIRDCLMPVRVLALVVGLPILLAAMARRMAGFNGGGAVLGGLAIGGAVVWCFVEGVVIVTGALRLAALVG